MRHPAYPSRRELIREASADQIVTTWQIETKKLRDAITDAIEAVKAAHFDGDFWPSSGMNRAATLDALGDCLPDAEGVLERRMEQAAAELVDDNEEPDMPVGER